MNEHAHETYDGDLPLSRRRVRKAEELRARVRSETRRVRRNWLLLGAGLSALVALAILLARR